MKALVVFDSLYGNTKIVTQAIVDAIPGDVKMTHVSDINGGKYGDYDLLIVGAPTHGGNASDPVKDMLSGIGPNELNGLYVTAFDTRMPQKFLRLFGFAGPKIAKKLVKKGGTLVDTAEGFFVAGGEGPLVEGELERAATWAAGIADKIG